jgi:hypothetical protein
MHTPPLAAVRGAAVLPSFALCPQNPPTTALGEAYSCLEALRGHSVGRKVEVLDTVGKCMERMHPCTPELLLINIWKLESKLRLCNVQGNQLVHKVLKNAQNFGLGGSHPSLCQVVTAATLSVDVLITLYIPSSRLDMSRDCSPLFMEKSFMCDESDGMRLSCRNVSS